MGNQEMCHGRGDIFKQIKGEMNAIEKSRSRTDIRMHNHLQKSASKSRFLDEIRVRRSRAQSAHSMTFEEEKAKEEQGKDFEQRIQQEVEKQKLVEEEEEEKRKAEEDEQGRLKEEEERKRNDKRKSINPYDDAPKKMDDILG